jgi:hypothetical protein
LQSCALYVQAMDTFDDAAILAYFPNYYVFRADRQSRGGGCVLLCRSDLMCSILNVCCEDGVESLFVTIPKCDRPTVIGVVYRKPSCSEFQFNHWIAKSNIDVYSRNYDLILTGDFNFPHIDWATPDVLSGGDLAHSSFLFFIQTIGLTQCNMSPTRDMNILDLVLFSKQENLVSVDVIDSLPDCDHDALLLISL